jgi:OOP family OmpA-OmpF porin
MSPRLLPSLALVLALLTAPGARAQEEQATALPGFELERLEINPGRGSLLLGSGESLPAGGLRLMVLSNYQHQPLVLRDSSGRLEIVRNRVVGLLSGAYGVFSWLEVGAQLPVVLWQRGQDLSEAGFIAPSSQGLGTPLLHARVGLLSQRAEQPVDLAVDLGLGLPLGSTESLGRDPGLRFHGRVVLGGSLGLVRPALEAGVLLRPAVPLGTSEGAGELAGPEIRVGAALATALRGNLNGELSAQATLPSSSTLASVELLGGVRYQIRPGLELFGMGGPGLGSTPGTPRFRVVIGLAYGKEPPPRLMFIDEMPARQLQLQEAAKQTASPEADARGPKPVSVWELNALAIDDPDRVQDPRLIESSTSGSGAPEMYEEEQRPYKPSSPERLVLRGTVLFEHGGTKLPDTLPLLDQVALLLQELPDTATVLIEGHSDAEGSTAYKRALSMLRAKAVRKYLVYRGVAASRLQVRGFGSDWPASTNTTEEGRRLNRRVEVIVLTDPPPPSAGASLP